MIEALKGVEQERRCFRMIGGILVERTVKDVLPALENNKEQVGVSIILVGMVFNLIHLKIKAIFSCCFPMFLDLKFGTLKTRANLNSLCEIPFLN